VRLVCLLFVLTLGLSSCGDEKTVVSGGGPSGSTLRATLSDPDGDGALGPGPAEPLRDRDDLAAPAPRGRVLATIGQLTDTQVRDEESPGRVPFLDRFGGSFRSTFRPQEALSTQVLSGAVQALNRERPQAVVVTGDIIDNAQVNELEQARAVLDGATVGPDTGAPGYDGVQQGSSPDPFFYRPDQDAPRHPGLLANAQRPFPSTGLRAPWYPALGNHDLLRQGELAPSERTDSVATGTRLVTSLDPEFSLSEDEGSSQAVERLLDAGTPGAAIRVPADRRRRALESDELVGLLGQGRRLRSPERLDYVFDVGERLRGIVLDTVNREGGARGIVSATQVSWLSGQIAAAGGRDVIVFSHNRLESSDGGAAAAATLAASPAVVANVAGNVHRNRVRPRATAAGGYWVIETSALADFPQQGRMMRLSETAGGGRVLETWMVEQEGRGIAGVARELAFLDAQGGRPQRDQGAGGDRNVRLFLPGR